MPPRKAAEASTKNTPTSPNDLGFESAMAELEALIQSVESNRLPLEETLNTYQRGQQLIARCNALLRDAEQRIQQFDGSHLSEASLPERS
jgi:exodeoxyribonuclease VII small subunit